LLWVSLGQKNLEVQLDERGNIKRNEEFESSEEGIFVAGDAGRGQSLIVWAIAEGRSVAAAVDKYLMGDSALPAPIEPTTRPLTV
jgi:glutamate synthase (NADPH/NADH) small chain